MRPLPADLTQIRPRAVCRRHPRARRAGWNRDRIRNGFLHYVALVVGGVLRQRTPWFELRYLLDDHVPATGAKRERGVRSDLIEHIILVVAALLAAMDIKSLRVGRYVGDRRKHGFIGLTVETIAKWTQLDEGTVSRILNLLRRAGLVKGPGRDGIHVIDQPHDRRADGSYEHHPAIRQFTDLFWAGLGPGVREQLHRLRNPEQKPEAGTSAAHVLAARAERARQRRARWARRPDG